VRPQVEEGGAAIDLPCFQKATAIMLKLGFIGLALPPSGVFALLRELKLVDIQLHGQSSGLGDLISSQRCPSLRHLLVGNVRGLDSFNIQSDSLLHMELLDLRRLQKLTVMAPALKELKVSRCLFTDNPDLSAANISAPRLNSLEWINPCDPTSVKFDNITHLKCLGIWLHIVEGGEDSEHNNHYGITLLRRFEQIHTLNLVILYTPVSPFFCHRSSVSR
jgi:hypothetical protein